ncbi:Long-chain acyl-CoA thioesterase FadM [Marinomonas gallaica]|uniref:Long-chain acyl-CoA thioesterase FadM n=1 Tax=Marinomonas gallaica TaxID=1806667 RepID=A0A1C3JUN7_9GAMM|nr:acyl-CoA thioesterase [Marinomonas gallaica]SBT18779.1 Long-chain acyl-CoA thioesterase FadM [Marinomonas gallaica]SBT21734.1 Long-chain acyl-CoA thioesterase FadM [Marinomonas gallaica]
MNMDNLPHTTLIEVRDYECDMQGIVNNAVYQNYLEHARHTFIKDKDLNFADITKDGIHLVVMRAEIDYKRPLKSGMIARVESHCEPISKFKTKFTQSIYIGETTQLSAHAIFIIASISDNGRPAVYKDINKLFSL